MVERDMGFIKVHRKLKNNVFYKKSNYVHLWLHLLIEANHIDKEIVWNNKKIMIKRGQFLTGRKQLSEETGIKPTNVERILRTLENGQQIGQQKTTKYRIITVLNYEKYQKIQQKVDIKTDIKVDNKWTTSGQQTDTTKNDKKGLLNDKKESTPCAEVKTSTGVESEKYELKTDLQKVVCAYKLLKGFKKDDRDWDKLNFARCSKSAKQLLEYFKQDGRRAVDCMQDIADELEKKGLSWTFETLCKRAAEWTLNNKSERG